MELTQALAILDRASREKASNYHMVVVSQQFEGSTKIEIEEPRIVSGGYLIRPDGFITVIEYQGLNGANGPFTEKVGGGLDLSYDGTLSAVAYVNGVTDEPVELPFGDKIGLGVMGSFEWVIARMSVLLQPGYHVIRKEVKGQTPPLYQRAGVKYHIFPNTFAGIYIKAYNFSVADYIEWTIGHRIKWK